MAASTRDIEESIQNGKLWNQFCDEIRDAGQILLGPTIPENVFDRAEGIRYLTRLLRAGLESHLEFGDPRYPGFYQLAHETIKIGNDNPDNYYQNTTVSGRYDYRITGTRGTVHYVSIGSKAGGYDTTGTMESTGQLDFSELEIRADGTFEIFVSATKPSKPVNWLPMSEGTSSLIVRQTFLDRSKEEPAKLKIECLNPDSDGRLESEFLAEKLSSAVAFVRGTSKVFVDWMDNYARHKNQLPSDDQEKCQRAGGDANIHYLQSYWELGPDEALHIHAKTIPECKTWNFQLSNFWMESLDYRFHRIHLNSHSAHYEADGSCIIVVAHEDPGPKFPNWLSTTGHERGGMLFRWIEATTHPPVETQVLKFAELASA